MVTPSSSLVDSNIGRTGFEHRHNCQVLGLQRHAQMIRSRMGQAKLAAGDLLAGQVRYRNAARAARGS